MLPKPQARVLLTESDSNGIPTLFQIIRFENALKVDEKINYTFDACFVPRNCHVTGVLDAHDVVIDADCEVVFVNTRFNCLAKTSAAHSFKPIWKPPFISKIIDEDRCHLNGLAMENGRPRFVTAASRSDTIDGWRDRRSDGGIVMDVGSNANICDGLSMPHSPRMWNGKLWVLNSGQGELGFVDMSGGTKGKFQPLTFCPKASGAEAAWAGEDIDILAPDNLIQLINLVKGTQVLSTPKPALAPDPGLLPDLRDIKGQESGKRALEVAAAGGHHLFIVWTNFRQSQVRELSTTGSWCAHREEMLVTNSGLKPLIS